MNRKFEYRPHIDGLRAVSVLAILLFHINPRVLPGGYLGVDVFFVISGYLITSLLTVEYLNSKTINFRYFYSRRFRRLFPSFILIVFLTFLASIFRLFPGQLVDFSKSLIASLFGVSNIYFNSTTNYFGNASSEKPFLHIWSLSVEEQFYFVWPLLILLILRKFPRKWQLLFALATLSFFYSCTANTRMPGNVFYLPFFRFYEFIFGASLAWFLLNDKKFNPLTKCLTIPSFAILSAGFLLLDSSHSSPGKYSIPILISTLSLIAFGDSTSRWNVLNWKIFRFLGRRSYTIYLVHWPLIVLTSVNSVSSNSSILKDITLFVLSIFLGSIIFKFYEDPIRRKPIKIRNLVSCFLAICLLLISASFMLIKNRGVTWIEQSHSLFSPIQIEEGRQDRFRSRIEICQLKGWDRCDALLPQRRNALIIGDSHAVDALTLLHKFLPADNFAMSTLGGCPPTNIMKSLAPAMHPKLETCIEINKKRYNVNYLNKFDYIAIDVLFGWYSPAELIRYLDFLRANNVRKIIVLGQYLTLRTDLPDLINKHGFDCERISEYIERDVNTSGYVDLKNHMRNLGYYFLEPQILKNSPLECPLWNGNRDLFSWDSQHVSYEFVFELFGDYRTEVVDYLDYESQL